jgi:hypothetical protein
MRHLGDLLITADVLANASCLNDRQRSAMRVIPWRFMAVQCAPAPLAAAPLPCCRDAWRYNAFFVILNAVKNLAPTLHGRSFACACGSAQDDHAVHWNAMKRPLSAWEQAMSRRARVREPWQRFAHRTTRCMASQCALRVPASGDSPPGQGGGANVTGGRGERPAGTGVRGTHGVAMTNYSSVFSVCSMDNRLPDSLTALAAH